MCNAKDRLLLTEMLECISEIEADTVGLSEDVWVNVKSLVRSVSMSLIALGEGARQLSDDTRARAPDAPWELMVSMRNRLARGYFRADKHTIWQTATIYVPALSATLSQLLDSLGPEEND